MAQEYSKQGITGGVDITTAPPSGYTPPGSVPHPFDVLSKDEKFQYENAASNPDAMKVFLYRQDNQIKALCSEVELLKREVRELKEAASTVVNRVKSDIVNELKRGY